MNGIEVVDIAHAIQLALAPVFLLSGIGVLLGVLTNRLARIVDRARKVEESLLQAVGASSEESRGQLLVALVVALIFASTFAPINLATSVAILFVLAMVALVGGLMSFLFEVRVATEALRIGGH